MLLGISGSNGCTLASPHFPNNCLLIPKSTNLRCRSHAKGLVFRITCRYLALQRIDFTNNYDNYVTNVVSFTNFTLLALESGFEFEL